LKVTSIVLFLFAVLLLLPMPLHAFKEGGQSCTKCHSLTEKEMNPILEKLRMPEAKVLGIRSAPVKGMWEVAVDNKGRRFLIYVDFAKKYISPGAFIDYAAGKDVTRERISEINRDRKIDTRNLPLDSALVIGKANAPVKVIVFTDPACGYCARLHKEAKALAARRPDIAFFLKVFALISPDPQIPRSIICGRSLSMLEDAYERKPVPKQDCATRELDENMQFVQANGIDAAPAIIFPDGSLHSGYVPEAELERLIDAAVKNKTQGPAK
jgi:thiol:disulfide interchange protein DsbC